MRTTLALSLLLLATSLTSAAPGDTLGSWDARGNYTSPARRERFRKLHRKVRAPVPRDPIVLVHGLFGFDELRFGPLYGKYFVGVAEHLRAQGMQVLVPETTPFAPLAERARELEAQIRATGWERFHIIAHSAGGLDSRYAISRLGLGDRVLSLTTVSTPHRGTWYADFALDWVLDKQGFWKVWDFLGIRREGIQDISVRGMKRFNEEVPDHPGVRYFSFGGNQPAYRIMPPLSGTKMIISLIERAAVGKRSSLKDRILSRGILPKRIRKALRKAPRSTVRSLVGESPDWVIPELAGKNDGLVSLSSARWGEHQVDLAYDHLDQMGWFTGMNVKRFYRNITRMLVDAGF